MELLLSAASVVLLLVGAYFTCTFKAFYIFHPIKTLRAMPKSGIKQMLLSLGGTVGVGNIAGVAVAMQLGGSGAVFWMWVGAVLAMALKYAEITLGMQNRGSIGYIKKALGKGGAILFSLLLITDTVVMGGMIQSNAVSEAMLCSIKLSPLICGIILSMAVAAVFMFKADVFKLSSAVVPIMSIGYAVCAVYVIAVKADKLTFVFKDIFSNAFSSDAAHGGFIGFLFTPAMRQGIVKGLFSNEAGCGTAPMAHMNAKEKAPAKQGLFGIFEVFADTVIMCTLTALVLLLTDTKGDGINACMDAFASVLGNFAPYILAAAILLFAFSATVAFGYYGLQCLSHIGKKKYSNLFIIIYCISVFLGALAAPLKAWETADVVVCLMLIINTMTVFALKKEVITLHSHSHIGKRAHSASKTKSFCSFGTKKDIPISESEIKRGSIPQSRQNLAK